MRYDGLNENKWGCDRTNQKHTLSLRHFVLFCFILFSLFSFLFSLLTSLGYLWKSLWVYNREIKKHLLYVRNDKTDNPPVWWQYLHSMSYIWIVVIIIYIHPAYILIKYKLILFLNNLNCFCFCFCFCFALTLLCLLIIVSYLLVFYLYLYLSFFPLFCFIYFINSIKNKIVSFLFFFSFFLYSLILLSSF